MGRPMARVLLSHGFAVKGWNRSPLASELTEGIPLVASLEEAASSSILLFMLSDSDAFDEVLGRLEPHLRAGQVVLDMGSSDPRRSVAHAKSLLAKGIGWVDAPVSGGPEGAKAATLAIMAGGDDEDFAKVKPVLEALGGNVVHVGGAGAGHVTKVINQIIVGLTIEAVAEALTLAERAGIDPRLVQKSLQGGFADSKILQLHGARMIERAYIPGGKAKTQLKDLRLGLELAGELGLDLPHVKSAASLYEKLVDQGDGDLDHSALHKLL
jgi:2-hydroxy-3-oxopropionate reductase